MPIVGAISAGAMGISPLRVGPARPASVAIVGARAGLRVRSRSSFRGLSVDCVADGLEVSHQGEEMRNSIGPAVIGLVVGSFLFGRVGPPRRQGICWSLDPDFERC